MNSLQDLAESVESLLIARGYDNVTKRRLSRDTGKEGIHIHKISDIAPRSDLTRSNEHTCIYQLVVVDRSERKAIELCQELALLLEGADVPSASGADPYPEQQIYTYPQELELGDDLLFAWEVRLSTEYYR